MELPLLILVDNKQDTCVMFLDISNNEPIKQIEFQD